MKQELRKILTTPEVRQAFSELIFGLVDALLKEHDVEPRVLNPKPEDKEDTK